eukprot:Plantae.Rhodophyta-Hildenbrandia_rubra.ctg7117.p1 GENE.Plantae.Rhodophyta-Hildenbrandia_rubra.ctg7117~~Plantae.Rhodophyta-Hildenbrandia_rubra.ctg7117.p1  ORF type:complete len:281 (+),score=47.56 Plantae.Rhodophyta-Hildenbrandia_rubra.ctg7117:79-921(+)
MLATKHIRDFGLRWARSGVPVRYKRSQTGILRKIVQRKLKHGIDRLAFEGPDPAAKFKHGWRLASAAVLERYPIVIPEIDPFDEEYCRGRFEAQNSWARPIPKEWFDPEIHGAEATNPVRKEDELAKHFVPADRITDADRTNDRKILDRALDKKLYFIVKRTEKSKHYQFPQELVTDPQLRMKEMASRALSAVVPIARPPEIFWWSNAPASHLEHVYPEWFQHKHDVYGIKIMFYRAQLVKGEVSQLRHGHDFLWVTDKELPEYFSEEYYDAVLPFLYGP